jgi:SAM-dependent methyltransferase
VFPWPCLGEFWFIEQGLLRHPDYDRVLTRLRDSTISTPTKFLDLGTCIGQDLRTLAYDRAPLSSLYGADVLPAFEAAGHGLFKDKDRFDSSHFITGDIFADEDDLAKSRGSWDMIHIAMFLHVFSLPRQEKACENILRLLRNAPLSIVFGTQTGRLDAGELVLQPPMCEPGEHKTIFRHSKDTMKEMWEKVAKSTGMKVQVWTEYDEKDAAERAEDRKAKGEEWKKSERFFTGDGERRIFFRVKVI